MEKEDKLFRNLIILLILGVLLMCSGVFLVGKHIPYGNSVLTLASLIVYISIIVLIWIKR